MTARPPGRGVRGAVVAALAVVAVGCASSPPSPSPSRDPTKVLHVVDRVREAVVISVGVEPGDHVYVTPVRPCIGAVAIAFGDQLPAASEVERWTTALVYDPTGAFDADLAAWEGDPAGMPGDYQDMSIMWSAGDIDIANLPKWLIVEPNGPVLSDTPPASPVPSTCPALDPAIYGD